MNRVSSIFAQILQLFPRAEFEAAVREHKAERHARGFSSWGQFIAMLFCQLGHAKSLREICGGLAASEGKLRHLGLPQAPSRSTLAYANEHRPWQLYQTVFQQLFGRCEELAKGRKKFRFKNKLLSLDATVIDLCAEVFDWAKFRHTKGAVKLHLLLDHDGYLPAYAVISEGKMHEIQVARRMQFEPDTLLVFDRGYTDYAWFAELTRKGVWFVTRMKDNADYGVVEERPLPPHPGRVRRDEVIFLYKLEKQGAECFLRRIEYWDEAQQRLLVFLTNNVKLAASTIAAVYKDRWQIGVSRKGHMVQSVRDRPRLKDSSLVAGEAPWRESKTAEPSDNMLGKEYAQRIRLQRAVNAEVASLHGFPVAETVDNVRKQQELTETSPMRRFSPAGYQRRHDAKDDVETGEALDARRRKLAEEMPAITAIGKCRHRHQGGGSGRSTVEGRAAKRVRREGPGPVSTPSVKVRRG
jgi:Domain of unknown function (DUF4372)/Transposase DDE domain